MGGLRISTGAVVVKMFETICSRPSVAMLRVEAIHASQLEVRVHQMIVIRRSRS